MSASLCWKPATPAKGTLPDALKFILRDCCGLNSEEETYGEDRIAYLRGLAHANVDGAQELIDLIEKHGEIVLWLEY